MNGDTPHRTGGADCDLHSVTLNEVKGAVLGYAPFASLRVTRCYAL
jgi:hypothetical protein